MAGTTSTIPITIGDTIIQFPASGSSPNWSPAIIQFAELVSIQLQSISSPFDVAPTVQVLTSNINAGIPLTGNGANLSFPHGSVRSFNFTYAVYQVSSGAGAASIAITGTVIGVYNTTTTAWSIQNDYSGNVQANGEPWVSFDMNSMDELLLITVGIPGAVYDTVHSTISYSAKTELVHT
jgi:hypothetical protein